MSLRYAGMLVALLALAGCSPVTQENFAKLEAGMSRQQVEAFLGKPGECAGALGMSSCTWGAKHRFISIQFAGDKVMMFSGQGLK
ncbi:outer membrane protein assembly factor BamE domain-containing protein [Stutzerimonas stutzeri]|uniref:outer membrane protein assembly factor BamE domain-containing protein n=1 Tax=Stutzerimonas stutzeri TaxID=316 RepID=UPI00210A6278|nr:outer membrane protein assembly factor BamE [Stutzerimonas stutzeri]MCQ4240849.1 outer membrane protein assembly factor BamE [Stutzerimonas stutzeri]